MLKVPAVIQERAKAHDIHPNLIMAVLSLAGLAYAMLSSAVIPALPTPCRTRWGW